MTGAGADISCNGRPGDTKHVSDDNDGDIVVTTH